MIYLFVEKNPYPEKRSDTKILHTEYRFCRLRHQFLFKYSMISMTFDQVFIDRNKLVFVGTKFLPCLKITLKKIYYCYSMVTMCRTISARKLQRSAF